MVSRISFRQLYRAVPAYDAVQDFSTASNPNGQWNYGYEPSPGGSFTADTVTGTLFTDCSTWYNGEPFPNGPGVALNTSLRGVDLDLPNVTVAIYENGTTALFNSILTFFGDYQAFNLSELTLKAGTTIDFVVNSTDDSYDNVGLAATIDQVK